MLVFLGMLGVIIVLLAEAHEWAEAHWITMRRRLFEPRGSTRMICRSYPYTYQPTTNRRKC